MYFCEKHRAGSYVAGHPFPGWTSVSVARCGCKQESADGSLRLCDTH